MSFEKFSLTKQIVLLVLQVVLQKIFGESIPIAREVDWGRPIKLGGHHARVVIFKFEEFEMKITMLEDKTKQGNWNGVAQINMDWNPLFHLPRHINWTLLTDGSRLYPPTITSMTH